MSARRKLTDAERQTIERKLRTEHEPRWVQHDDLQRIGRSDEDAITVQVRDREAAEKATMAQAQVAEIVDIVVRLEAVERAMSGGHLLTRARRRKIRSALTDLRAVVLDMSP